MAANYGYIYAIVIVLAISVSAVSATLKCWRCTSDSSAFCADPFDKDAITEDQRALGYANCSYSYGMKAVNTRQVCKKLVQEIYGKIIVTRSCFVQDIDDPSDKCVRDTHIAPYIKNLACETCTTDGCNGAAGFAPIAALLIIPVAVAKLLVL